MTATLVWSWVWRSCHDGVLIFSVLPKRMYLANPAEPAASTSEPCRCRCPDSRLSTSEYTACSGPRAAALVGVLVGAAPAVPVPVPEEEPVPGFGGAAFLSLPLQASANDGTSASNVAAHSFEVIAKP